MDLIYYIFTDSAPPIPDYGLSNREEHTQFVEEPVFQNVDSRDYQNSNSADYQNYQNLNSADDQNYQNSNSADSGQYQPYQESPPHISAYQTPNLEKAEPKKSRKSEFLLKTAFSKVASLFDSLFYRG